MDQATAERWVVISAFTVVAIYAYRRLKEAASPPATLKKLIGAGPPPPLGAFATAWGFTYFVIAIMAEASPGLGGAFAILIMTGDFLTNSQTVFADVLDAQKPASTSTQNVQTGQQLAATGLANPNTVQGSVQTAIGSSVAAVGRIGWSIP